MNIHSVASVHFAFYRNVDVSGAMVRCLEDIGYREETNDCSLFSAQRDEILSGFKSALNNPLSFK